MTVIGHLANAGIVAGTTGLLRRRVVAKLIAYYLAVMLLFIVWIGRADPKNAAALYIDWTGNIAGLYFVWRYWRRGNDAERFFVAMLVGSQLLAGFSHSFDLLLLKVTGHIPEGIWRPQHFWHTPGWALFYCTLVSPIVWKVLKLSYARALGGLLLGYALHICADTITYDFPIYWAWPFSSWGFSFDRAFVPVCNGETSTFGAVLYKFGDTPHNPHWGWVIYWAEPLVNVLLAALFVIQVSVRSLTSNSHRTGEASPQRAP